MPELSVWALAGCLKGRAEGLDEKQLGLLLAQASQPIATDVLT